MFAKILKKVGAFGYKFRFVIIALFAIIFGLSAWLQTKADISYSRHAVDEVLQQFPMETLVVLYDNSDEDSVESFCAYLDGDEHVKSVQCYGNTVGQKLDAAAFSHMTGMPEDMAAQLFYMYAAQNGLEADKPVPMLDLFTFLSDDSMKAVLGEDAVNSFKEQQKTLAAARANFVGATHSRLILTFNYKIESEEMTKFFDGMKEECGELFEKPFYFIGDSAMSYEISDSFTDEYTYITIGIAAIVFAIVCISFRRVLIPAVLVCIIQCAVFIMMSVMGLLGTPINFIAMLCVQCILMGAMVDYGIVMTNYFREVRQECGVKEAVGETLVRSAKTILISSLIVIVCAFTIGLVMTGEVGSILTALGVGTVAATLLVFFVLPSVLVVFDRFITIKPAKIKAGAGQPVEEGAAQVVEEGATVEESATVEKSAPEAMEESAAADGGESDGE